MIRDSRDLTVIQCHDAEAEPCDALEQAMPAHRAFQSGVWLERRAYTFDFDGRWNAQTRTLTMVVLGREVTPDEMLQARGMVIDGREVDGQPIARVRYLFTDEREARAHLHAMWLREFEVWTFIDGVETRLDATYVPPPYDPPAWVKRVRERDGV